MSDVFGRTNRKLPAVWLSLQAADPPRPDRWAEAMVEAALETGAPIDVSSSPALWGGLLRNKEAVVIAGGGTDVERASESGQAADAMQAHLIQVLSATGRDPLDLYFFRLRRPLEEHQVEGALEALSSAREEGLIGHLGLWVDAPALAVLSLWQFRDAFEAILLPKNPIETEAFETLAPVAKQRRVGLATYRPLNWGLGAPFTALPSPWKLRNLSQGKFGVPIAQAAIAKATEHGPVLVGVRSVEEIRSAVEAPSLALPEGVDAMLEVFADAYRGQNDWRELTSDPRPYVREAARRRLKGT